MTLEKIKSIIDKIPIEHGRNIEKISISEKLYHYSIDVYFVNPRGFVNRIIKKQITV